MCITSYNEVCSSKYGWVIKSWKAWRWMKKRTFWIFEAAVGGHSCHSEAHKSKSIRPFVSIVTFLWHFLRFDVYIMYVSPLETWVQIPLLTSLLNNPNHMTSSWQFNGFANNACFLTKRGSQIVSKLHWELRTLSSWSCQWMPDFPEFLVSIVAGVRLSHGRLGWHSLMEESLVCPQSPSQLMVWHSRKRRYLWTKGFSISLSIFRKYKGLILSGEKRVLCQDGRAV